jgi:hypothetical protein
LRRSSHVVRRTPPHRECRTHGARSRVACLACRRPRGAASSARTPSAARARPRASRRVTASAPAAAALPGGKGPAADAAQGSGTRGQALQGRGQSPWGWWSGEPSPGADVAGEGAVRRATARAPLALHRARRPVQAACGQLAPTARKRLRVY